MHTSQRIVFKTQQAQCLHAFPLCSQRPYIQLNFSVCMVLTPILPRTNVHVTKHLMGPGAVLG